MRPSGGGVKFPRKSKGLAAGLAVAAGLSFAVIAGPSMAQNSPAGVEGAQAGGDGTSTGTGTIQMPPVQVIAQPENATGPVPGYVAHRSATATKTDTPLILTPQSISVVTRDQIDDQGARNLGEALRYTSGVAPEFRGISGGNFDQIIVRGYTVDRYWDGLKVPAIGSYASPMPDLYLFERVEVLKGPSSVLFGQASPGGVVNQVSKRPTATPTRELRVDTGSYGRTFGAVDVSGPLDADGHWLYRLTAAGVAGSTQVDYTREGRIVIAPSLTWRPSADTTLTLLLSYQYDPAFGYYDVVPVIGTAFFNPRGQMARGFYAGEPNYDRFSRSYFAAGYLLEHKFSEMVTARQNVRYVRGDFSWNAVQFNSLAANNATVNRYALRNEGIGGGITVDNQVELNFGTGPVSHRFLLGLDLIRSDAENRMWTGTAQTIDLFNPIYGRPPVLPVYPQTNNNQVSTQLGFYAQDQIRVGNLIGLFGVRRDAASQQTLNRNTNTAVSQYDAAFTWRAALLYAFDIGVSPYASYTESFQPTAGTDFYQMPFKPRTGRQYEIGVKYQPTWADGLFTAAYFEMTEQNRTTPDIAHTCAAMANAPGCGNFNLQIGEVKTRGIELEGKINVTRELALIGTYTWLDARITQSNSNDVGQRLTNTPSYMASAWFDYTFRSGPAEGFGLGGGVRYMGSSPANTLTTFNYFEAPAYTLFDAMVRYDFGTKIDRLKGLGARLNVRNLFDVNYVTSCGGNSPQAGYCFNGAGRTLTASLNYRW